MILNKKIIIQKWISVFILTIINLLFYIKYVERISEFYFLIAVFFTIISSLVLFIPTYLEKFTKKLKYVNLLLFLVLIALSYAMWIKIPIETINVDRWEIITLFWQSFERGDYVYGTSLASGNQAGAMPFYFLISYPFYLFNVFELIPIVALLLFYLVLKYAGVKPSIITTIFLYLILSPTFLWEVATRSTLYLNGVLVLFSVVYFLKKDKLDMSRLIIAGVLFGLFLSIRFVYVLAYAILVLYSLKSRKISIQDSIVLAVSTLFAFALTYLPFLWGHFEMLVLRDPISFQSNFFIPFYYTASFVLIAVILSFFCKNNKDVFFYSGLCIFISIGIYFVYWICKRGVEVAFFDSRIDISYFIFCIPFVLYYYAYAKGLELQKTIS